MPGYDRIIVKEFGGPEVMQIEHVAELPEPGAGQVRIRVEAAGVGYTDTILRRGRYLGYTDLPMTPGYDVVGRIDRLGAGVTGLQVGDRIADMSVVGAYSQYLVLSAGDVLPVPAGLAAAAAVDVPLMAVTAWQMLTRILPLPPGSPILVVGAGGAVGRALVMLGRHLGHTVIGTCSAGNLARVEALGAMAIDYGRADLADAIQQASGGGVSAAFDAIGGASWDTSWSVLAKGGILVAYGFQDFLDFGGAPTAAAEAMQKLNHTWPEQGKADGTDRQATFYDIRIRRGTHPEEYRADALFLLGMMAEGKLVPVAAEILPVNQAVAAHRRIAAGGLAQRLVLQP